MSTDGLGSAGSLARLNFPELAQFAEQCRYLSKRLTNQSLMKLFTKPT